MTTDSTSRSSSPDGSRSSPSVDPRSSIEPSDDLDNQTAQVARSAICCDLLKGMTDSKMVRGTVLSAVACLTVFFLVSNPVGWIASAIGISALAVKILFWASLVLVPFLIGALPWNRCCPQIDDSQLGDASPQIPVQASHLMRAPRENRASSLKLFRQEVSDKFSSETLTSVLKSLKEENIPTTSVKPLIWLGYALMPILYLTYDEINQLSESEKQVWNQRKEITKKAESELIRVLEDEFKKDGSLELIEINQFTQVFLQSAMDENGAIERYRKDGHRYEKIVLAYQAEQPVCFPGENTASAAKEVLLKNLKDLATNQGILDENLFILLQEAVSQDWEKIGTTFWLSLHLEKEFGARVDSLICYSSKQQCVKIEKIGNNFKIIHEYIIKLSSPFNVASSEHRIRLEYLLKSSKDGWEISKPCRTYINKGEMELEKISSPKPLAKIASVEESDEKRDE